MAGAIRNEYQDKDPRPGGTAGQGDPHRVSESQFGSLDYRQCAGASSEEDRTEAAGFGRTAERGVDERRRRALGHGIPLPGPGLIVLLNSCSWMESLETPSSSVSVYLD